MEKIPYFILILSVTIGLSLLPQAQALPETWLASLREPGVFSDDKLLSEDDLAPYSEFLERLQTTGFSLTWKDQTWSFPAQGKDLILDKENGIVTFHFTREFLAYMETEIRKSVDAPAGHITLLEADETKVSKVTMEGHLTDGLEVVWPLTETLIHGALTEKKTEAQVLTRFVEARIINKTGKNLGPMDFLGAGKTSFWGSSPEREFNIRKAVNEKFNGILIPQGGEFSYVEWLGPIEYGGWKKALTIFQGTQLEPAAAGGVCQVSTTMYRAVLDAALDITEYRNHSLYVIYYQHFGDGLDATIFPGEQDFKFVNNTGNYLLMTAQEEGYMEAVIRFFGEDDGRSTQLYGPYTASNQTEGVMEGLGAPLGIGQMAWKYVITWGDAAVETRWLLSDYMSPVQQHREEITGPLTLD